MASTGKQFRELLKQPGILISPGVYDGYGTRLAAVSGFKTGAISGAGVSESRTGWADHPLLEKKGSIAPKAAP